MPLVSAGSRPSSLARHGYVATVPELGDLVSAYWRHHALSSGDRAERLASQELSWAWDAVDEAMEGDDPLGLLDALLEAPGADPGYLGAGPVGDLLAAHGPRWQEPVALRCRTLLTWRDALGSVWLDEREEKLVPLLAEFLPPGSEPKARLIAEVIKEVES